MPSERVPREIVGPLVDLLHKWNLRVNKATWLENPMDLAHNANRIGDVLQNGLANHNIRHRVRKREIVSIGDDRGPRSQRRIYGDDVEQRLCAQQLIESAPSSEPPTTTMVQRKSVSISSTRSRSRR